jgi:hypothetical protein
MKAPHLLRVTAGPETFGPLFDAAGEAGLRIGWLDLTQEDPVAPGLDGAAKLGAARAVAAGPRGTVAVKRRRGPVVLADLLREHFLGCCLVLVRGILGEIALLDPRAAETAEVSWTVAPAAGKPRVYGSAELIAALRRPHPWPEAVVPPEDSAPRR